MTIPTHSTLRTVALAMAALGLAALACNAPGAQPPDTGQTVQAVYATITQQANLPPMTPTALPATANPLPGTPTQLAPAATPTAPESRGTVIAIHRCPNAITVDANPNDWPTTATITTLNIDQVNYDPKKEWTGPADLSGTVKLCWTDASLFLLAQIVDNVHVQTQRGENSYKGDEVELMFDADLAGDFYNTTWDGDDTQLSLNPGDFGTLAPEVSHYRPVAGSAGDVEIAAKATGVAANYQLEARIGWAELGSSRPVNARNYGLCVAVSDADHPELPPQEDKLLSHCPGLSVPNPTTWPSVTFVP